MILGAYKMFDKKIEDTKLVISYLSYLRDISRKIFTRNGFNKCYFNRKFKCLVPLENNSLLFETHNNEYRLLQKLNKIYERHNDTGIFIGFGNIIGKNSKIYSSPLILIKVDVLINENDKSLELRPDCKTLSLNIDLLSSLTSDEANEDDIEKELPGSVNTIIEKYDQSISEFNLFDINAIKELTQFFFDELKKTSYFKDIELGDNQKFLDYINSFNSELKLSKQYDNLQKSELQFYTLPIMFIHTVPSQLSSYEELNKMINLLEKRNNIGNELLEKLLINTLNQNTTIFKSEDNFDYYSEILHRNIPLSLSATQHNAVCSSWLNEISYIQGPPGTGKSHTIIAILLTAILLKKRVLICSQKPAAVQIINERIKNLYTDHDQLHFVNYFNRSSKSELKNYLSTIIKLKKGLQTKTEQMINNKDLNKLESDISTIYKEIKEEKENLINELTNQFYIKKFNDDFQLNYEYLEKSFDNILSNFNFRHIIQTKQFKNILGYLESYNKSSSKSLSGELYILKLIKSIEKLLNIPNSKLTKDNVRIFWKSFIDIIDAYNSIERSYKKIKNDIDKLRTRIDNQKYKLEIKQKEYISIFHKYNMYNNLFKIEDNYISEFSKLLNSNQTEIIENKISLIDYSEILDIFPIWTSEIRDLGKLLPLEPELFDLVIIDEASQVNLAEIIPVLYRAKKICIVGDHLQLGLKSIGMGFSVSRQYDNLTWNNYLGANLSYDIGKNRMLNATQSSILDFIRSDKNSFSINETLLDEHFRSLPKLAQFTSKYFYSDDDKPDGKLNIMTELPDKMILKTFQGILVDGSIERNNKGTNKVNITEAKEVIEILKALINKDNQANKYYIPKHLKEQYTIGIISLLRNQCEKIEELIDNEFNFEQLENQYKLMVGTPEEFQGNERDIIIISLCVDGDTKIQGGTQFYEDSRRFNVATSRAKYFTYCVHSKFQNGFKLLSNYLNFFDSIPDNFFIDETQELSLKPFNLTKIESNFERIVYEQLCRFKEIHDPNNVISIHNQILSCGRKRLDFVLYNNENKKSIAIEVDGYRHFQKASDFTEYSKKHIERLEVLKRAGWIIINTPYHKWYKNGVQANYEKSIVFRDEIDRIFGEIKNHLLNEN